MSVFVTSTGTEVGKTLVCRACLDILRNDDRSLGYFKPVASGCRDSNWGYRSPDEIEIIRSGTLGSENVSAAFRFRDPLSPDIAAERENRSFDIDKILNDWESIRTSYDDVVVEGIGGVAVPFNNTEDVTNLIERMELPVILVVSSTLGTISHTRTAMSYLEQRNVNVPGIVLTPMKGREIERINRDHLRRFYPERNVELMPQWNKDTVSTAVYRRIESILEGCGVI